MRLIITAKEVPYRKGHIEVSNVHKGCVNVEMWSIHPDVSPRLSRTGNLDYEDGEVTSNVELELTADEARELADGLLAAAAVVSVQTGAD